MKDQYLYNEGLCLLVLRSKKTGICMWRNQTPGGPAHLRPLRKAAKKMSAEDVAQLMLEAEEKIKKVRPLETMVKQKKVKIEYRIRPSMHDGAELKVRQFLV